MLTWIYFSKYSSYKIWPKVVSFYKLLCFGFKVYANLFYSKNVDSQVRESVYKSRLWYTAHLCLRRANNVHLKSRLGLSRCVLFRGFRVTQASDIGTYKLIVVDTNRECPTTLIQACTGHLGRTTDLLTNWITSSNGRIIHSNLKRWLRPTDLKSMNDLVSCGGPLYV